MVLVVLVGLVLVELVLVELVLVGLVLVVLLGCCEQRRVGDRVIVGPTGQLPAHVGGEGRGGDVTVTGVPAQ